MSRIFLVLLFHSTLFKIIRSRVKWMWKQQIFYCLHANLKCRRWAHKWKSLMTTSWAWVRPVKASRKNDDFNNHKCSKIYFDRRIFVKDRKYQQWQETIISKSEKTLHPLIYFDVIKTEMRLINLQTISVDWELSNGFC